MKNLIVTDPEICHGKPCFKGTRILVSEALEILEGGESIHDVVKSFPALTVKHVRAALHYAANLVNNEEALPLAS